MAIDNLSLDGKIALVTGSGRENGIGAGIAWALARNGAAVAITYVTDAVKPRADTFVEKIRAAGGRAAVLQANIDTPEGAKSLVDGTLKAFGTDTINILVNNAGFSAAASTLDTSPSVLDSTLNVNVKGAIFLAQAVVPHMPVGGRIINISSTSSKQGMDHLPIYGASKAALDSLTWSWAKEWGRSRGITVNTVAPGPVSTDLIPEELKDVIQKPLREITRAADRVGTIEDIADAVLLLVSELSRWITGQYISVSGGITN